MDDWRCRQSSIVYRPSSIHRRMSMATKPDLLIAVDSSTTASKAVIWDRQGQAVAEGRASFPLLNPQPGWYEQRADLWWDSTAQALRAATSQVDPQRLGAICITHQRESFV